MSFVGILFVLAAVVRASGPKTKVKVDETLTDGHTALRNDLRLEIHPSTIATDGNTIQNLAPFHTTVALCQPKDSDRRIVAPVSKDNPAKNPFEFSEAEEAPGSAFVLLDALIQYGDDERVRRRYLWKMLGKLLNTPLHSMQDDREQMGADESWTNVFHWVKLEVAPDRSSATLAIRPVASRRRDGTNYPSLGHLLSGDLNRVAAKAAKNEVLSCGRLWERRGSEQGVVQRSEEDNWCRMVLAVGAGVFVLLLLTVILCCCCRPVEEQSLQK